jgi:hypothetical protein
MIGFAVFMRFLPLFKAIAVAMRIVRSRKEWHVRG